MNTALSYQYRDAANYKQCCRVVFAGEITAAERSAMLANLDDGQFFLAGQVGLEDLQGRFGRFYEDDHVWHELEPEDIELTDAPATEVVDIHAFATLVATAVWDVHAAQDRIGLVAQ